MNLQENINRIKEMMGLIVEEEQETGKKNITESVEGKRCWYYKKIAHGSYENESDIPNVYNGAADVQDFLIKIGHSLTKDGIFGNRTATALGTWTYGVSENINTVYKLWERMKKDGWDVGETSGYGPKMTKAVADMIIKICKSISKTCKIDKQTYDDFNSNNKAKIVFENESYDYGDIDQGEDQYCSFVLKNTGNVPLIISNVKSTCGCTIPKWPTEPINPGDSATIRVKYDTERLGIFNKKITVYSNASNEPVKTLNIKGNVK